MMLVAFWVILGLSLALYAVTAGADLGSGVWTLLARGPRRRAQQEALEHAIAPIWETNHVWLIILVVVLFTVFPRAFAALSISLHIPLTLALIGIVIRGSSLALRAYGLGRPGERTIWTRLFGVASGLTPLFLGMALGAMATGSIRVVDGRVTTGFFAGWLDPFAWSVGVFCVLLFALSAAVYMTVMTEGDLRRDFAKRAIALEVIAGVGSLGVLATGWRGAPIFVERLLAMPIGPALQIGVLACAVLVVVLLRRGSPKLARAAVALQVVVIVFGYGYGLDGHLLIPDVTVANSGARPEVLVALVPAMVLGAVFLIPSLVLLYRLFRPRPGGDESAHPNLGVGKTTSSGTL